jgi:hypothetical protein
MKPAAVSAAIQGAIKYPTRLIDPGALRALADLAAEYLGAHARAARSDMEIGGATRSLRATEAALREALGDVRGRPPEPDWSSMPGVPMRPVCAADPSSELRLVPADLPAPPLGAKERILASTLMQSRAEIAVKTARAVLRVAPAYRSDDLGSPPDVAIATLAAGLLTAESHAELLAVQERLSAQFAEQIEIQRRAFADDQLRVRLADMIVDTSIDVEIRRALRRLLEGV